MGHDLPSADFEGGGSADDLWRGGPRGKPREGRRLRGAGRRGGRPAGPVSGADVDRVHLPGVAVGRRGAAGRTDRTVDDGHLEAARALAGEHLARGVRRRRLQHAHPDVFWNTLEEIYQMREERLRELEQR